MRSGKKEKKKAYKEKRKKFGYIIYREKVLVKRKCNSLRGKRICRAEYVKVVSFYVYYQCPFTYTTGVFLCI